MHSAGTSPFVSVIVPVKNGGALFRALVEALAVQDYPKDAYEVIVADNGSDDGTYEWSVERAVSFPVAMQVVRADAKPGSYAARNEGIVVAKGEILAFTDSDCRPVSGWLAAGVGALRDAPADFAGGNVRFVYSDKPNAAEWTDAHTNMQMERDILWRKVTKTANLFAKREIFEKIGSFPGHLRSGGDVWWTQAATDAGFALVYAPEAEVCHPTRSWGALFKKQLRVGYGQIPVLRAKGMSWLEVLGDCFNIRDKRPKPKAVQEKQKVREEEEGYRPSPFMRKFAKVWCRAGTLMGRLGWVLARPFGNSKEGEGHDAA